MTPEDHGQATGRCEVCEEPVRDLGFIVHPEEGTSICHRCAYELVAAEVAYLRSAIILARDRLDALPISPRLIIARDELDRALDLEASHDR